MSNQDDNAKTQSPALQRFVVCYTRIPTNFNPTHRALVDAETAELARALIVEQLGDHQNTLPNYVVDLGVPYMPVVSAGKIHSMTGG
jgi:hypothetical protein